MAFGHELQHAVEIARAPEVISEGALVAFYERIGQAQDKPGHYETKAAPEVAGRIRAELSRFRGTRI